MREDAASDSGGRPGDHTQPDQSRPATRAFTTTDGKGPVLVRMRTQISGSRNGVDWPARGETVNLPEAEAGLLVRSGIAEPVDNSNPDPVRKRKN